MTDDGSSSSKQNVGVTLVLALHSAECVAWLERAWNTAEEREKSQDPLAYHRRVVVERIDDGASSEDDGVSSDGDSSSSNRNDEAPAEGEEEKTEVEESAKSPVESRFSKNGYSKKQTRQPKHRRVLLQSPPMTTFSIAAATTADDRPRRLELASALLNKTDKQSQNDVVMARSFLNLSRALCTNKPAIVLLLRSGRFAGGVFQHAKCLLHRTSQRYTVRRGQGKAQSSQDTSKRKAQSVGAQLRRAGEEQLQQDVQNALLEWKAHLANAAVILWSCPKTMRRQLFEKGILARDDERLRHVPLDFGRPSYESVCAVHETMMRGKLMEEPSDTEGEGSGPQLVDESDDRMKAEHVRQKCETPVDEKTVIPLTPLHEQAANGDLEAIKEAFVAVDNKVEDQIDQPAGEDMMTPLHYAAQSCEANCVDPSVAADVVYCLLLDGQANPCMVDARHRVPYFLASHDKIRDAFRRARATLGEECWPWDDGAKVGPALTDDDVERKKEKAAEKKRRQRARQKEKKSREKAQAESMEQRRKEEEDRRKQEEDSRRVRDGLQPKSTGATNVCDFCQKVCKGKRRSQMFQRLDYVYCSADCVQKHKRELMAAAAMARFG